MSQLEQNTASLDMLISKANALPNAGGGVDGVPLSRIVAGVIRYNGTSWTIINNEAHVPINITGISGNTPDSVTITFPEYAKVNSFVVVPDERLAAAGIKCGASVGGDYATICLRQDRNVRLMVYTNAAGSGGNVVLDEFDDRTDISGFTVKVVDNATLGKYVRIEDTKGNINGKSIPTFGGSFFTMALGAKDGYLNVQLRSADGTVSDYKNIGFQCSWSILNGTPVLTSEELSYGNLWVFGIMEESS